MKQSISWISSCLCNEIQLFCAILKIVLNYEPGDCLLSTLNISLQLTFTVVQEQLSHINEMHYRTDALVGSVIY